MFHYRFFFLNFRRDRTLYDPRFWSYALFDVEVRAKTKVVVADIRTEVVVSVVGWTASAVAEVRTPSTKTGVRVTASL